MNIKEAREIVNHGVIPGDIDSVDLAIAQGYLEALRGEEVGELVTWIEKNSSHSAGCFKYETGCVCGLEKILFKFREIVK